MKTDWNIKPKSLENALGVLKAACSEIPTAAVILGSGVNVLMNLESPVVLPFEEVFGLAPTVAGHAGSVTLGRIGTDAKSPLIVVFRGRFHLYEGHDWSVVTLPTRIVMEWGIPKLLLTNAAGGLNRNFNVGDLMVLTGYRDFLNPKHAETGLIPSVLAPAIDCRNSLTEEVLNVGGRLAKDNKDFTPLQSGTYSACLGPSYETLAEIDMLRRLNSDAVGMSTVPELESAAEGSSTKAAAISVVTNVWNDKPMGGHAEVLEASHAASRRLDMLFDAIMSVPLSEVY